MAKKMKNFFSRGSVYKVVSHDGKRHYLAKLVSRSKTGMATVREVEGVTARTSAKTKLGKPKVIPEGLLIQRMVILE